MQHPVGIGNQRDQPTTGESQLTEMFTYLIFDQRYELVCETSMVLTKPC